MNQMQQFHVPSTILPRNMLEWFQPFMGIFICSEVFLTICRYIEPIVGDIIWGYEYLDHFTTGNVCQGCWNWENKVGAYAGQHCFVETFGNDVQIFQTKRALIPAAGDIVEEDRYQNVYTFYQKLQCMEIVLISCLYLASEATFGHNLSV